MEKSKLLIKKLLLLSLILVMCFNTMAAVVSDNDGSAFITNELSDNLIQFNFL